MSRPLTRWHQAPKIAETILSETTGCFLFCLIQLRWDRQQFSKLASPQVTFVKKQNKKNPHKQMKPFDKTASSPVGLTWLVGRGWASKRLSPAQLLLEVHHVLVALCVVRSLGLHEVIQAAQVVGLEIHQQAVGTLLIPFGKLTFPWGFSAHI